MENEFSALILSSGLSERMGQPKALLRWNGSTTFIEKIISEFHKAGCVRIVCMINDVTEPFCRRLPVPENVEFVVNPYPERGRFYSLKTGLNSLKEGQYCFVHNIDNPFVNTDIIEKLLSNRKPDKWCSPVYNRKGGHPVLIPQVIIKRIAETVDLDTNLSELLRSYPKTSVGMDDDMVLRNINTTGDFNKYFGSQM